MYPWKPPQQRAGSSGRPRASALGMTFRCNLQQREKMLSQGEMQSSDCFPSWILLNEGRERGQAIRQHSGVREGERLYIRSLLGEPLMEGDQ